MCPPADLVWRMHSVSEPQGQAHGNLIAWVESWSDPMDDRTYSALRLARSDGSNARALTNGKQRISSPAWSTDGSHLAYISDPGGRAQIYVLDIRSGVEHSIETGVAPTNLAWSPDGR